MKKLGPRQMDVGVGDGHGVRFDGNHHDVRIGFADVVFDREPGACASRRRRQAGMTELQLAGRLDPAHEGLDRGPILRQQPIDVRVGDDFLGMGGGKTVERLVQIHDQTMQAVAAGFR